MKSFICMRKNFHYSLLILLTLIFTTCLPIITLASEPRLSLEKTSVGSPQIGEPITLEIVNYGDPCEISNVSAYINNAEEAHAIITNISGTTITVVPIGYNKSSSIKAEVSFSYVDTTASPSNATIT